MDEPHIILPGGYQSSSGLYLPSSFSLPELPEELPPELLPGPGLLVVGSRPSFMDQVYVYATQLELGLDPTPREVIVGYLREMSFWPAMRILARWQRDLWSARVSQDGQRELLHRWYGDDNEFVRRAAAFMAVSERHVVFSEQQLFALQKLVTLYSSLGTPADELTNEQYLHLVIALAAVPGSVLNVQELRELGESEDGEIPDERWLRLFIGHGGFIGKGSLKHDLARAHRLYAVLANSEQSRKVEAWCPIDDWLLETVGLSFIELQAVGFSLHAGSKIMETGATPSLVDATYYASTAFAGRAQVGLEAISAEREWYRDLFARSENDERRTAFEITPFLQRPALRYPDGRVMPIAPRALEGWLGATGAYYRILDVARAHGPVERERFSRFNGYLTEVYTKQIVELGYPPTKTYAIWVPRSFGEISYRTAAGESKTPDVSIDLGQDLVFIEVTSGRPTVQSVVDADPDAIRRDITRLLEEKIRQLGGRITDFLEERVTLEGVQIPQVERIWPIIVNSEGLFQTPSLWDHLRANALHVLDLERVQPLTLLDLEDLERLMALVTEGHRTVEILRSKTQEAWREREFASWYESEGRAFGAAESAFIDLEFKEAIDDAIQTLLGDESVAEYRARLASGSP